jgi:hypothetical protein
VSNEQKQIPPDNSFLRATYLTPSVTPHRINPPDFRSRAPEVRPSLDACTLVFPGAVFGSVDRAGCAVAGDANGQGSGGEPIALALAVVDRYRLILRTGYSILFAEELSGAGENGGGSNGEESGDEGGESDHAGNHNGRVG